jgi:hypothetical protein
MTIGDHLGGFPVALLMSSGIAKSLDAHKYAAAHTISQ